MQGTGPQAAARRLKIGRQIAELGNIENEAWGTEHGYRYESSPVIPDEPGYPPVFDMREVTPSTWPGSRLPHVFLADGSAVYDRLGKWFTLIVLNGADTSSIESAAAKINMPLTILRLSDETALRIYEKPLLLVRPDQHVAWRGDVLPHAEKLGAWRSPSMVSDCTELLDKVRGIMI